MNERQKRLIEVYDHLRKHYGIHTKTGFAEALHYGRTSMSAALNGNESYLTDKLFENICECWPSVFNLDYLLTGKGYLLTTEEYVQSEELDKTVNAPQTIDQSSMVNALIAAQIQTIESLKEEKSTLINTHARELQVKDDLIQSLREQLRAKDDHIATLKERLTEYRRILDSRNGISDYPFPIGVAEHKEKRPKI